MRFIHSFVSVREKWGLDGVGMKGSWFAAWIGGMGRVQQPPPVNFCLVGYAASSPPSKLLLGWVCSLSNF